MKIEEYHMMREIRINRWFNWFLIVLAVFCLVFLVYVHCSTQATFAELDAMTAKIARNMP